MTFHKAQLLVINIKINSHGYKEKILKNVNFERAKVINTFSQETNKPALSALIKFSHKTNEIFCGSSKQGLSYLKIMVIH